MASSRNGGYVQEVRYSGFAGAKTGYVQEVRSPVPFRTGLGIHPIPGDNSGFAGAKTGYVKRAAALFTAFVPVAAESKFLSLVQRNLGAAQQVQVGE